MPASKAQQKAVSKYMKENYDEIKVRVGKGKKAAIQAHAEAHGESVNGFINRAIDQTMAQEAIGSPTRPAAPNMTLDCGNVLGTSEGRIDTNGGGVPNE